MTPVPGHKPVARAVFVFVAVSGLTSFVVAISVLHGLRADLNPEAHTISEYSLGNYGWLMRFAFAALGVGVLATAAPLRLVFQRSTWRSAGLVLLVIAALGLFLDTAFNTDHPRVIETLSGSLHGMGMLMISLGLPAATFLFGSELSLTSSARARGRCLEVLAAVQLTATLGFEMGSPAFRGLTERTSVGLAVISLAVLQSLALSSRHEQRERGAAAEPAVARPVVMMMTNVKSVQ